MLRLTKNSISLFVLSTVLFVKVASCLAESSVTNDELLKELESLKRTVVQQDEMIKLLEERLSKQETHSKSIGADEVTHEIDKRIDERLSQRAPGYQLMEGLSMGVESTTIVQAAHNANGDNLLSAHEDCTAANMIVELDFNKKFDEYGEGYVKFKSGPGAGVDRSLQLYGNVNNNAVDNSVVYMPEAWYEHYFTNISAALTFGKLDATNYIDTNEYANLDTTQFLSGIFGNSPVIEFPSSNGLGLHLGIATFDFFDINLVAEDSKGEWDNVSDAMFLAGEINLKPKFLERPGNYRFLAWSNKDNHTRWTDSDREKENGYGYGVSFDQELTDVIGVFARYGWQDPKVYLANEYDSGCEFSLERSFSLGAQFKAAFWNRPLDVTGVGFGQIMPSRRYKNANGLLAKTESHFEWYYNYKVNDHFSLSPDLQMIWQPYGKDAANGDKTIVLGGLRAQMEF